MMPITAKYDPEARAMYVRLQEAPVASSVEVDDDFVVDMDASSKPIGVELLALPATEQQLALLAARFGFFDRWADVWSEVRRAQPPQPTRSGVSIYYTVAYPSAAPVAVGASSASLKIEAHDFALSA
jgi:uncharacterized protein YuzE